MKKGIPVKHTLTALVALSLTACATSQAGTLSPQDANAPVVPEAAAAATVPLAPKVNRLVITAGPDGEEHVIIYRDGDKIEIVGGGGHVRVLRDGDVVHEGERYMTFHEDGMTIEIEAEVERALRMAEREIERAHREMERAGEERVWFEKEMADAQHEMREAQHEMREYGREMREHGREMEREHERAYRYEFRTAKFPTINGIVLPDIDQDGDGSFSRAEVETSMAKKFDILDEDGDGVLSVNELQSGYMKRRQVMDFKTPKIMIKRRIHIDKNDEDADHDVDVVVETAE